MTGRSNVDYYELLAGAYDLFFADLAANMEAEGRWLDAVLRPEGAARILDACCGSGRQAIPLARRGYHLTGADPSQAMLREARRGASAAGVDLELHESAFAALPGTVGGGFDAVVALGNGLCNQEGLGDIRLALEALRRCCRPDGLCVVGIKDFDAIRARRPRVRRHSSREEDGRRTILRQVWDYADPLLLCRAYLVRDTPTGRSIRCAETREYMLGQEGLTALAREAGFRFVERLDHPSEAVYALR